MKSIILFSCLIICTICLKMTPVNINSRTPLPTTTTEDKYFYLQNSDYQSHSSYIYIYIEDINFSLDSDIKFCYTDAYPESDSQILVDSCSFSSKNYYDKKYSSNTTKYYYRLDYYNNYYYTIVYYSGRNSSGSLYVTTDYNDLVAKIQMTKVNLDSRTSLPTTTLENKYFYLTISDYSSYSNYIYSCLEDNSFVLSYSNLKFCYTNTNPNSYTVDTINDCSFSYVSDFDYKYYSGTTYYYFNFQSNNSYSYLIISYDGSYSSGSLYVISDYNVLVVEMTQVYQYSRNSLPTTTSKKKFFCLPNSYNSSHTNYIYFDLEDISFGLRYSKIKYCYTNTDPYSYPEDAVNHCSFHSIYYYDYKPYSNSTMYYYNFSYDSSYNYVIVSYEGSNSSGSLYVTYYHEDYLFEDESKSNTLVVFIVMGSILFLAIFIIIYVRCYILRKKKIDIAHLIEPNNEFDFPEESPLYQPDNVKQIPLQATPMDYSIN